jgi:predicted ArsR family transcriptional regulator
MSSYTIDPSGVACRVSEFSDYEIDPADLTREEVEDFIATRVKKRIQKTKAYQRAKKAAGRPKGFWATLVWGFKKAISWVWEKFTQLMDMILNATVALVRFLWNNGGEEVLRAYVARELTALLR